MHGAIDLTSLLNSNGDKEIGDEEADASLTGYAFRHVISLKLDCMNSFVKRGWWVA